MVFLTLPGAPRAQTAETIQNHDVQRAYIDRQCVDVIEVIDREPNFGLGTEAFVIDVANQGMVWGVLLGYELARPGIRGSDDTILQRLRKDCAKTPEASMLDLLKSYEVAQ